MQIIPVIDLLNATVVHAKKGERTHYQPIQSLLSNSSAPLDIVAALLDHFTFDQLYIADLNAIQNIGDDNSAIIKTIARSYPTLKLWVDAGIHNISALTSESNCNFNVILGSENFSELDKYLEIKNQFNSNCVLSLDFMPQGYSGPAELIENSDYWPQDVILMSLTQVGANQGPNIELHRQFKSYASKYHLYAAGGIRNIEDVNNLKSTGASGALIASALHQQQITPAEFRSLNQ